MNLIYDSAGIPAAALPSRQPWVTAFIIMMGAESYVTSKGAIDRARMHRNSHWEKTCALALQIADAGLSVEEQDALIHEHIRSRKIVRDLTRTNVSGIDIRTLDFNL